MREIIAGCALVVAMGAAGWTWWYNRNQVRISAWTNLYVVDSANHKIRKIVISTGVVTTPAGLAQGTTTSGDTDATGNAARFNSPRGITTDGTNLYVANMSNNKIRKIQ